MTGMAALAPDPSPAAATRCGRILLAALGDDFDPDEPQLWQDLSAVADEMAAHDMSVLVGAILIVVRRLFGQPADVRAITGRLNAIKGRIPDSRGLPLRDIEAQIRVFLGEHWLHEVLDHDAILAAGIRQLAVWRELMMDYLDETGTQPVELVAMAEDEAAVPDGLAAQVGSGFRLRVQAMLADPDVVFEPSAAYRRLREIIWERQGTR
jgi:hypothetical protein